MLSLPGNLSSSASWERRNRETRGVHRAEGGKRDSEAAEGQQKAEEIGIRGERLGDISSLEGEASHIDLFDRLVPHAFLRHATALESSVSYTFPLVIHICSSIRRLWLSARKQ